MSERTPLVTGSARPGPSFSPGRPSLESNFRSVRPIGSLPNRLNGVTGEHKFAPRVSENSFKPFSGREITQLKSAPKPESSPKTAESKTAPVPNLPKRGSERFGSVYRIGQAPQPLDRRVGSSEVARMLKVAEAPKPKVDGVETKSLAMPRPEANPTRTEQIAKKIVSPEDIARIVPESPKRTNELAKPLVIDVTPIRGSSRYEQRSAAAARLNTQPKVAELPKSEPGGTQSQRAEVIEPSTASRRTQFAELLKTGGKSGTLQELLKDTPPTVRVGDGPGTPAVNTESRTNPVKMDKIADKVAQHFAAEQQQPRLDSSTPKPETTAEAVKILEIAKTDAVKIETAAQKDPTIQQAGLQPHIAAAIRIIEEPGELEIHPDKRAEAIKLITELSETKEYAANPKMQEQLKKALKAEQEKVIEEDAVAVTAEQMMIAGFEDEVIIERLQAVVGVKKLPLDEAKLLAILQQAEVKVAQGPRIIVENGAGIEEEEVERKRMLRMLQELMIQLDQKALENRFKSVFNALEKTWVAALEQGFETIDYAQIVEVLPDEEPKEEVSEMLKPLPIDRTDGSRVEAIKEIRSLGSFDNLDVARRTLTSVLLKHLPGQVTQSPSAQVLSDEQVQEILKGGRYPSQMGRGIHIYNSVQINQNIFDIAA